MQKILLFSIFLIGGLAASQILPGHLGDAHSTLKLVTDPMLYLCLAFIMINVGREFLIDKNQIKSYTLDYFVAMATAAMPWVFTCIYFMFLLPEGYFNNWEAWKENLLLSRFAAPTSAGILFTMLAAAGLKSKWIYSKVQVLAIFDDLDTILLMIPLQIMMVGFKWQLFVIVFIVTILLWLGWKYMGRLNLKQNWYYIALYSVVTYGITHLIYVVSKNLYGPEGAIHIEVLLPAFVLGMMMNHKHIHGKVEERVTDFVSYLFMLLVGISMPHFIGMDSSVKFDDLPATITSSMEMMDWGTLLFHVVMVTALSNIGKMVPVLFYRDRDIKERLAISIGMFTRGEVGAAIIFLSLGYGLGGPLLIISVLTIALNLILTGFFVLIVRRLALSVYGAPEKN